MYSKDELKQLKTEFWAGYHVFCKMLPGMEHRKDNFLLNTGIKGVEFKYDATRDGAFVILEINTRHEEERLRRYEQFERYKSILEEDFPGGLVWDFAYQRECGSMVCRIYSQQSGIDLHRRTDWMSFYRFMSSEMLKLEAAFLNVKDVLE